jgi:hypothetical protein
MAFRVRISRMAPSRNGSILIKIRVEEMIGRAGRFPTPIHISITARAMLIHVVATKRQNAAIGKVERVVTG